MTNSGKMKDIKNNFWKSLEDYNNDPKISELKQNEFLEGVTEDFQSSKLPEISRRKFLALLAASAAVTATACTDYRDKGEIIPYNKRPENITPGISNYYASTCNGCTQACGILIKTREGRPIKIDGNPDHPINKGKICSIGHASILNLYDPERLSFPTYNKRKIDWDRINSEIINNLKSAQSNGKEIAILTNTISSPTTKKVLENFTAKYSNTKIYSYDLINDVNRREAWYDCYGDYEYPSIKWNEAEVILALDSDFLGSEGNYIEAMNLFTQKRESVSKLDFNRLYSVEGRMSVTGSLADYRFRISPDMQYDFVMSLINEMLKNGSAVSLEENLKSKISEYSISRFENLISSEKLKHLVNDLNSYRGKSIVHAGDTLSSDVHTAVNLLNEILGNSEIYDYKKSFKSLIKNSSNADIENLIDRMNNGKVGTIIHFDSNPVYNLASDFKYSSALKKVETIITLTESETETSELSHYVLPINNQLESWGDAYVRTGVYSLQQPVISPIFDTRQKEAILLTWINENAAFSHDLYHSFLINSFNEQVYFNKNPFADARSFWLSALHDGVVTVDEPIKQHKKINASSLLNHNDFKNSGYTLHLTNSYYVRDGRFANNGWLQELPHPITKIAWDNYAAISPSTAKKIGVENNDLVEVNLNGKLLTLPAFVQPGMSDNTINIELGYGRSNCGNVGKNVGFNSINLISKNSSLSPYIYINADLKKSSGTHILATTQEHHSLDDTFVKDFHRIRNIIKEGTLQKYKNDPKFLHHDKHEVFSITNEHKYDGMKWAMAIDLNKCTNCSVCVSACNVENNIPVVGKSQVERGREMQWIRIDRYYSGSPEEPIVSNQPMLCQHCDNAPCENVCPVNATNHSPDGLNQMAYNRCVGTRYCANNCPYKVRRFNFFNFRDEFKDSYYDNELTALVNNPEVTVRSRGIMEKCTFCVQRIMEARSDAIRDGRELKGSDVVTACQQACPSNAIVFGNANDPDSPVAKLREHNLSYHVLEELNVKPNVTYIAKLRNTHSEEIA